MELAKILRGMWSAFKVGSIVVIIGLLLSVVVGLFLWDVFPGEAGARKEARKFGAEIHAAISNEELVTWAGKLMADHAGATENKRVPRSEWHPALLSLKPETGSGGDHSRAGY